jgi:hypothetical protein
MQLVAYVGLTVSSIIVACSSLFMAYRQNFGWKPIVFASSYGGGGGKYGYTVTIEFELWNRKKHPISIRFVSVTYEKTVMDRYVQGVLPAGWQIDGEHRLFLNKQETVEPGKKHHYDLVAPIQKAPIDLQENVTIDLFYFDPIKNKIKKITVHTKDTLYIETLSPAERRKHRLQFWRRLPLIRRLCARS